MSEKIKIEELIQEIIHIACQAEISADDQVKRQALGDIYDAIASVLPVDHARIARGASPTVAERATPIQPDTPRCDGRACRSATADGLTGMKKFLHIRDGLQMYRFRGPDCTLLIGSTQPHDGTSRHLYKIRVSKVEPNGGQANLYVDGKLIFTLGSRFNPSVVEKMSISALKRWEKVRIQRNKMKLNQRKRKAAEKRAAENMEG